MIEIRTYTSGDKDQVIALVLQCQNDGTRPNVTVKDQPELLHIQEKYIKTGGNFWVAVENSHIIGSIGLMNAGNGLGILKKFFVSESYRGAPHHLGRRLYNKLTDFAKSAGIQSLLLDTPKNTGRAHIFYEKAGFKKIMKEQLPVEYDYPYSDSDFFYLENF